MTTQSIVQQLANWSMQNSARLTARGLVVDERFPQANSPHPWKASVGLTYDGVVVSYTVWERTQLQTELLVLNTHTGKTVVMKDTSPVSPSIVSSELDEIAENLLNGVYREMSPDPRLTIS